MGIYNNEEQEVVDLIREYGTADKKKIEKIKKERKENEKTNRKFGCFLFFLLIIFPVFVMGLIQKCSGGGGRDIFDTDAPWEPRHTYIQKPILNNVNSSINMQELLQR